MALRVPRNPETRAPTRQLALQQAAPGLDVRGITQGIDQLRAKLDEDRRADQQFQLNRRLMDEVNALQTDFVQRQHDPSIGVDTFAATTNQAYTERHSAILNDFYKQGYDTDLLDNFDGRLATVRQGLYGNALAHQVSTLTARAGDEIDQYTVSASQLAASNPLAWTSVEEDIRETISSSPYLTEEQKLAKIDESLTVARNGAGKAYALQHPEDTIQRLDPQGFTAPPTANVTPGRGLVSGWQGVATTVASELGLDATEVASVMSFETGGKMDPALMGGAGGNYMGLIQFGPEERQTYGIDANSTPEEWSTAILGFMKDRGFKKGMGLEDFYSTILTGGPGRYDAQDANGTSVRNAIPRILSEHRPNAERWLASATIDPGASTAEPAPEINIPSNDNPAATIADVQTGVPILDALNGPERLQVLGWAREQQSRAQASQKATMDVTLGNIQAEALQNGGEVATPIPTDEEILTIYGPVEGPQRVAAMHKTVATGKAIQTFRTMSDSSISSSLALLEPVPGSPTYETELQVYEAAQRAASALATEREADPAAYALKYFPSVQQAAEKGTAEYYAELDRVYEQLGIDSQYAAVLPAAAMERVVQDYKTYTPQQRREYIQQNFRSMGEDRFQRFVNGMEGTTAQDDARIYALMRNYRGAPGEWENVFQQVLEGREVMAQDPARRPSAQALREQFRLSGLDAVTSLNAQASRAVQEAAAALYASRGGNPTQIDIRLYKESLATALGGSLPVNPSAYTRAGKVTDFTILPPKTTVTQFNNWIDNLHAGDLTRLSVEGTAPLYGDLKTAVPLTEIIDNGVFVMTSPGRYMIKMAADGKPLLTQSGHPFLVNIDPRVVR